MTDKPKCPTKFDGFVICLIILGIIFAIIMSRIPDRFDVSCQELGYDYQEPLPYKVEPGYINCCKETYVDHIATEQCDVIKEKSGGN